MLATPPSSDPAVLLKELERELPAVPAATAPSPPAPPRPAAMLESSARIVMIDDEPINVKVLGKYLKHLGYQHAAGISHPEQAWDFLTATQPDLVILDVMMPGISGIDILRQIRADALLGPTPVIILTAAADRETRLAVLEAGATDFLTKPIDPSELAPRVRNALALKRCHDQLRAHAQELEEKVRARTAEVEQSRLDIIRCLGRAAEFRDDDTGRHVIRVGRYAAIIAEALGFAPADVVMLEQAAQLHDLGKIGIPDSILLKPGKLTAAEMERMRQHTFFGKQIVEPPTPPPGSGRTAGSGAFQSPMLQLAAKIALTHHEWWNGNGYPLGLKGEQIPLEGRITAVADVFDALSSRRPYKAACPLDKCFEIITEERGTHFDPRVVEAFLSQRVRICTTQLELADHA